MNTLEDRKAKIDDLIKSIFKFLLSDDFQLHFTFDSEETELTFNQIKQKEEKFNMDYFMETIQNDVLQFQNTEKEDQISEQLINYFEGKKERNFQKEFIPSKRYFLPLEQGNNEKEWGKLDQETINDKLKFQDETRTQNILQKLDHQTKVPYMKKIEKDDIQKKWLEGIKDTQMGKFVDTRPDKRKPGFYIDTVKNIDKNMDDKIDKVIKKFMTDKMKNFNDE